MRTLAAGIALLALLGACGGESQPDLPAARETAPATAKKPREFLPRLTDAHLPPLLAGLVPGTSTAEDVRARFPALETDKDKSFGGTILVRYNGRPAVALHLPRNLSKGLRARADGVEDLQFYLVPDAAGVARIRSMRLVWDPRGDPTLCAWLHEGVGSDPESLACSGTNRSLGRVGKSDDAGVYCIGTPDGTRGILVECRTTSQGLSEIEYDLLGSGR